MKIQKATCKLRCVLKKTSFPEKKDEGDEKIDLNGRSMQWYVITHDIVVKKFDTNNIAT